MQPPGKTAVPTPGIQGFSSHQTPCFWPRPPKRSDHLAIHQPSTVGRGTECSKLVTEVGTSTRTVRGGKECSKLVTEADTSTRTATGRTEQSKLITEADGWLREGWQLPGITIAVLTIPCTSNFQAPTGAHKSEDGIVLILHWGS